MSSHSDIISFDLKKGKGSVLDIEDLLPLSHLHPLDHTHGKNILDDMKEHRETLDLFPKMKIKLERFSSLQTLDIATKDIRRMTFESPTFGKSILSVIPHLYLPYGSIDIRRFQKYKKNTTYPDLFARSLPYWLLTKRFAKWTKHLIFKKRRTILLSLSLFCLFSLPLLFFVKVSMEAWYRELSEIKTAKTKDEVLAHILSARSHFERSYVVFFPFSWIPLDQISLAHGALVGGLELTRGLDTLGKSLPLETGVKRQALRDETLTSSYRWEAKDYFFLSHLGIESPTLWIRENKSTILQAMAYFKKSGEAYRKVEWSTQPIRTLQGIGWVLASFENFSAWYFLHEDDVLSLLGDDEPKRYIVFNQNRDEIRANGGFPWSVFTFTLYKWNILDARSDDVYYYDWNLFPYKEIPPPGIALLTGNYGLRDVNYYPDFRLTLEKANSFIERSGDSTLTTGIAIHQGIIEDILEKIGPVSVVGLSTAFTHENFSTLMSTLVESEYGRENSAKDILFAFIEAFQRKIIDEWKYKEVLDSLYNSWKDGQILMASRDEKTDAFLSEFRPKLPWEICADGAICSPNWAYPVFTSVGGNKSDRYIERTYRWETKKIFGCKYENIITLTQKHTFWSKDKEEIESYLDEALVSDRETRTKELQIQWNAPNKSFVRLYVPLSSELSFSGSDVTLERNENATVFSFTLETPVASGTSKTLRYTTNIPHCQDYDGNIAWSLQPWLRKVLIK